MPSFSRSVSSLSLVSVASLLLAVAGALACSAPPGSGVGDDEDGPRPFSGNTGSNPAMSAGGLQPAPLNPAAPGSGETKP